MHRIIIVACLVALAGTAQGQSRDAIDVSVDARVELICIISNLAGFNEYAQPRVASYAKDVAAHFGAMKDHQAVQLARELRATRGIGFDAPMSLAVHLKPGRSFELAVPLDPWPEIDQRWRAEDVERFLDSARRFAEDSRFNEFFDAHRELYALAEQRMRDTLRDHANLGWFDEFFGARPQAEFRLVLGMLNGGANYGPRAMIDGKEQLYCILGMWRCDDAGNPRFAAEVVPTVVHEFCHSYANPLIDANYDALRDAGDKLFAARTQQMRRQAYSNGQIVLRESLVRACVIRYVYANDGAPAAVQVAAEQVQCGFTWAGDLAVALADYESKRTEYPTLESYMPLIVKCLNVAAEQLAAK